MKTDLRPVTIDDIPHIVTLHAQTFAASRHLGVLFGEQYLTRMYSNAVSDPGFILIQANCDGALVGFSSARLGGYHSVGLTSIDLRAGLAFMANFRKILTPSMLRRLVGRQVAERRLRKLRRSPYAQAYITCVKESSRGSGIGSKLRNGVYHECQRRGVSYLYTGILSDNAPMLAISRRDGFHEIYRDRIGSLVYLEKCLIPEITPAS